jgi:hydroxymethylpyrimidine pyrophosphatase-like HAD family hydrolase
MRARGYAREECIAVGDSREDAGMAEYVGRFFLVANAGDSDPRAERTEGSHGEGFYEAVVRSIAEGRTAAAAWS